MLTTPQRKTAGSLMAGNVYVFNATPYQIPFLILNNFPAGTLAPIVQSSGYAAASVTVARNPSPQNPGNNTFGGQNTLIVDFTSGTSQKYQVNIDSNVMQINSDLQLYLFYSAAVLVAPSGAATQLVITGTPVSHKEIEEVRRKFRA